MKHFLITRFNLKLEEWKTAKDGSKVLTNEWLDQRFELFEKYCLTSVLNQSSLNFEWFIFFDIDTPSLYQIRINELIKAHNHIHVVYTDGFMGFLPSLKIEIGKRLKQTDKFIITTRLDNDDAIHRDFIKTVQGLYIEKHETVIDLRRGYQLKINTNEYEVRKYNFPCNQFVSLVESSANFNTVLSRMHVKWAEARSIIIEQELPYWIEIIHERNKENDSKKYLSYSNKIELNNFGIDYEHIPKPRLKILLLNSFEVYPYKLARFMFRGLKKLIFKR